MKTFECRECLFKASTAQEVDDHVKRRHKKEYRCGMCDFVNEVQEEISEHEKEFHKIKNFNCSVCEKTFKFSNELKQHSSEAHGRASRKTYSYEDRRSNGYCRFWNHSTCKFGQFCKFVHDEAPHCKFQDRCRAKPACQYFHEELSQQSSSPSSSSFLGHRTNQGSQNTWKFGQYH